MKKTIILAFGLIFLLGCTLAHDVLIVNCSNQEVYGKLLRSKDGYLISEFRVKANSTFKIKKAVPLLDKELQYKFSFYSKDGRNYEIERTFLELKQNGWIVAYCPCADNKREQGVNP